MGVYAMNLSAHCVVHNGVQHSAARTVTLELKSFGKLV